MKNKKIRDEKEERRYTGRLFLWAVISALVCAALGVFVLVYYFVPRDNDTYILTVPSFVGRADGEIEGDSAIEIKREWIYSGDTPKGEVISQTPYAGARRKLRIGEKYAVTVFISLGEQLGRVPDLRGVGENSAAAALRGLRARVRSVAIYGDGEDGRVLYTVPQPDSEIRAGDTVTMFVSRRRVEEPITVPDFCGLELAEAYRLALALGLYITDEEVVFLNSVVYEQSIPEGAVVKRGSYISFKTVETDEGGEREWPPSISESDRDKRG